MRMKFSIGKKPQKRVTSASTTFDDSDDALTVEQAQKNRVKNGIYEDNDEDQVDAEQVQDKVMKWREEGAVMAEHGDYQAALGIFQRCISLCPTDYKSLEMRAQVYLALDMLLPAVQSAEAAAHLNPSWSDCILTLARCQREIGELRLSLASYLKAVELDPLNEEINNELKEVKTLVSQFDAMIEEQRINAESDALASIEQQEVYRCKYHLAMRTIVRPAASAFNPDKDFDKPQNSSK